jgi:hypothetical protein
MMLSVFFSRSVTPARYCYNLKGFNNNHLEVISHYNYHIPSAVVTVTGGLKVTIAAVRPAGKRLLPIRR